VFSGHLSKLGRNLATSVESFNSAVGSLERQVLPGARKFTELGVRPDREIESLDPVDKLAREPQWNEDYDLFAAVPEPEQSPPPSPPPQGGGG
jgi:DNA recombination protein RmuC